jgi:NitT/TauT family transport system permease protein
MVATFRRVTVGFIFAILIAIPTGIAMGTNDFLEDFFEVETVVGVTIPGLMWGMLSIMFFGIQELAVYFAVTVIVTPMLTINLWEGMKNIDAELIDMAVAFESSTTSRVKDVILPQLLPYIFASARYGLGLAWKVVVIIELLGFSSGIGYKVNQAYQMFQVRNVLAWTILFTMIMLVLEYGVLNYLEDRWLGWRPETEVWRR